VLNDIRRDLAALWAQGQRAEVPLPPELVPGLVRGGVRGLLNAAVLPLLTDWELPYWLRRQLNPADPGYHVPGPSHLLINASYRNWTAVGPRGGRHEAIIDPCGLVTPLPTEGWSLDCWVQPEDGPLLTPAAQPARERRQRLQDRLPVVVSAFEARALRLSTEAWGFRWRDVDPQAADGNAEWLALQAVIFNSSEEPLRGRFYFAVRPFNPEGIGPITALAYIDQAFLVNGRLGAVLLPAPTAWDVATGQDGDLARRLPTLAGRRAAHHPAGLVHGIAAFDFVIAPWEEAEFLAFCPFWGVGTRDQGSGIRDQIWLVKPIPNPQSAIPNPQPPTPLSYGRLKGRVTRDWKARLGAGMQLRLPDSRLEESWEASKAHLLVLHDGDSITPGPATYHGFWLRDAAYMLAALAATGYGAEAWQVLATYPARQRRDGAFRGPTGEGDSTGQALWTVGAVQAFAPNPAGLRRLYPALGRGADWIIRKRGGTSDGLLPPSRSAEHLGPPDRYYWDSFWGLAGLEAVARVARALGQPGAARHWQHAAAAFRADLERSLQAQAARLGTLAIPAAPGRRLDAGMIGGLVAWSPLNLFPPTDPRLDATLAALRETSFYDGAFYQPIHFGGWGTYLNMRIAQCLLARDDPTAWDEIARLLRQATPTYTWPEAIHPRSGGGAYGDGQHGWASAEWLLLLRRMCLFAAGGRLRLGAGWPAAWFAAPGELAVERAPTRFGSLAYSLAWTGAGAATLTLTTSTPPPGGYEFWLPFPVGRVLVDGAPGDLPGGGAIRLPPSARVVQVYAAD
jgi:hypothetical protein